MYCTMASSMEKHTKQCQEEESAEKRKEEEGAQGGGNMKKLRPSESQDEEESESDQEYEVEMSERDLEFMGVEAGEDDCQRRFDACTKNQGHEKFIKVNDFRLHHIPKSWRRKEILHTIRRYTAFTVKVIRRYTSPNRPDKYSFFDGIDLRGTKLIQTGSGRIDLFSTLWGPIHQTENQPCPLENCKLNKEPHQVSATFYVYTAAHIVYDDQEARNTEVQIVVDNVPRTDPNSVIKCQGVGVTFVSKENDACYFKCVTHELDKLPIVRELGEGNIHEPEDEVEEQESLTPLRPDESLTFIVSFPHGTAKHITLGEYMVTPKCTDARSLTLMDIYKVFGDCQYENIDNDSREAALQKFGFQYHQLSEKYGNTDRPVEVRKIIERIGGGQLTGKDLEERGPHVLRMSIYSEEFKTEYSKVISNLNADFAEKTYLLIAKETLVNLLQDFSQTVPSIYYETATCPGSSGAPVFVFQPDDQSAGLKVMVAPHSRKSTRKNRKNLNVSGIGAMWDTEHTKFPLIMRDVFQ